MKHPAQSRLRSFIRRRVPDAANAEDILQDVFYRRSKRNRRATLMPALAPPRIEVVRALRRE